MMAATRVVRSAKDKASEALDLSERKVDRLTTRLQKAQDDVEDIQVELKAAIVERDYAAKNPALNGGLLPPTEDDKS